MLSILLILNLAFILLKFYFMYYPKSLYTNHQLTEKLLVSFAIEKLII